MSPPPASTTLETSELCLLSHKKKPIYESEQLGLGEIKEATKESFTLPFLVKSAGGRKQEGARVPREKITETARNDVE